MLLAVPLLAVAAAGALFSSCTDRWAGPTLEEDGKRLDVRENAAPKACGWEHVRILTVPAAVVASVTKQGPATGLLQYASDPLGEATMHDAYRIDDTVPSGIVKTRYHKGGKELWIRPDDDGHAVIVLDSDDNTVERWPRIDAACLDE